MALIAVHFIAVSTVQSQDVIAGWHTWAGTGDVSVGKWSANETADPNITATFDNREDAQNKTHGKGSTDGDYGTLPHNSLPAAGTTNGASIKINAINNQWSEYDIEIVNGTEEDITLSGIHFDIGVFFNPPDVGEKASVGGLWYSGGDLEQDGGACVKNSLIYSYDDYVFELHPDAGTAPDHGAAYDFQDLDFGFSDFGSGTDPVIPTGGSARFELAFHGPVGAAWLDNLAFTRSVVLESADVLTITSVGGGNWELTLKGKASTSYEFYSSTTLNFDTGTLVPLTVSGTPGQLDVTTDGSGNATVQMSPGGSANFVRAGGGP